MKSRFLSKYFPAPKFLKPHHIGITFSDANIKAISFGTDTSKHVFKNMVVPLPKGVIVDGKVVGAEELAKQLAMIKDKFDIPFVFFTLPDELVYIFSVSVPVVQGGNAIESVAFTIEENVPISLSDSVFDFSPMEVMPSKSESTASVVVAACVKKEIEKYVEALDKSGFEAIGCLHESQAITNAVIIKDAPGVQVIVHARDTRVGIYLVKNNTVVFSTLRSITSGDYKKQFLDEYQKFLEYSVKYGIHDTEPIDTVFICGNFEYAKQAVEGIGESDSPVKNAKLGNVWSNVLKIEKEAPSITFEDSLNFAGPVGAVLADIL